MIKAVERDDLAAAVNLAVLLWPGHTAKGLMEEFTELVAREDVRIFLKYKDELPVGFAQCQLRYDYVEGTQSSPVGYLEGIFVKEEFRHQGYAEELLTECEKWAKMQGCEEFASDCELHNTISARFHQAMHFTEANRIICYTKKI